MSKAAYQYPPDEFDAPPDPDAPRGVHRAPRSAWSRWWPLVAVIVVVPLLAWGAVKVLSDRGDLSNIDIPGVSDTEAGDEPTDTASQAPGETPSGDATSPAATSPAAAAPTTPAATTNLATPVTVLNGAKINGLAKKISDQLTAAGFTSVKADNATGSSPATSTVFYGSDDLAATAQLVAQTIKVTTVVESATDAPSGITVVLRSDPGA